VKVARDSSGSVTVQGGRPLASAISVVELAPDGDRLRLDLPSRLHPVRRPGSGAEGTSDGLPHVLPAPEDGDVLVEVGEGDGRP
jgi:hypothetical protein